MAIRCGLAAACRIAEICFFLGGEASFFACLERAVPPLPCFGMRNSAVDALLFQVVPATSAKFIWQMHSQGAPFFGSFSLVERPFAWAVVAVLLLENFFLVCFLTAPPMLFVFFVVLPDRLVVDCLGLVLLCFFAAGVLDGIGLLLIVTAFPSGK